MHKYCSKLLQYSLRINKQSLKCVKVIEITVEPVQKRKEKKNNNKKRVPL